jgi:hypothetical protein
MLNSHFSLLQALVDPETGRTVWIVSRGRNGQSYFLLWGPKDLTFDSMFDCLKSVSELAIFSWIGSLAGAVRAP